MNTTNEWPPKDLGRGPNPYDYGTWQWYEHECMARYRSERFWQPFMVFVIVLFAGAALLYGAWGFGWLP